MDEAELEVSDSGVPFGIHTYQVAYVVESCDEEIQKKQELERVKMLEKEHQY